MSSSVGYPNDKRIISYVVVERDSNEKQTFKAVDNNVIDNTTSALFIALRMMPMLGVERRSAR